MAWHALIIVSSFAPCLPRSSSRSYGLRNEHFPTPMYLSRHSPVSAILRIAACLENPTFWPDIPLSKIGLHALSQQLPIVASGFCASAKSRGKASLKTPCVEHASSQYLKVEPSPNFAQKNSCTHGKICLKPCQNGDASLVGAHQLT